MMYEKPEVDRRKLDDAYLLSEIARLKRETEEIRKILDERQNQMNILEKNTNTAMLKLSDTLNKLSEDMEDVEMSILEALTEKEETLHNEIELNSKKLQDAQEQLERTVVKQFESLKMEILSSNEKVDEVNHSLENIRASLSDKVDKKTIFALHQRTSTMFGIVVVNTVGIIMVLGLLCYLIISLAR